CVAHVRPDSPSRQEASALLASLGARVCTAPWELGAMAEALASSHPDCVMAVLGTTRKRAKAAERAGAAAAGYDDVDYGLTSLLLRAVTSAAPRARFVYLSSLGVSETTTNPYLLARRRLEAELVAGSVPYTIVRPSFVTGPDRAEARPGERVVAALVD